MSTDVIRPVFAKISDYVFHHASTRPDAEAIVWKDQRISYTGFAQQVEVLSRALIAHGIGRGDRIALLGMPRPEFIIVMMAAVDIGAIWMGMHPRYKLAEFRHVVELASPSLIFAYDEIDGRNYVEELCTLKDEYQSVQQVIVFDQPQPGVGISLEQFLQSSAQTSDAAWLAARNQVETDDSAVIIFTSGTTGRPKGAQNSHYGLVHCAHIELSRWPGDNMRVLQNMPINHIANIGMMSAVCLVAGGTLVMMERFDPAELLQTIEREKITFWLQSPVMFHMAVSHKDFATTDLSSLEYLIWGGGPMPKHLVEQLQSLDINLAMAYGMTELTAYATYADQNASAEVLANTIGRPEPRYDMRLMTEAGETPGAGEKGEIQARGRWLMNGYFNQPEATADAYTADGWFKTGDVAELRQDGNWRLVGRTKEMYKSGGYNIYPREIEIAMEEHPGVAMTAVLGVADEIYNEVGYAFVQPSPDATISIEEIRHWCHQRLANYKVPKTFEIMAELPTLPIGKIDKQGLRKRLDEGLDQGLNHQQS